MLNLSIHFKEKDIDMQSTHTRYLPNNLWLSIPLFIAGIFAANQSLANSCANGITGVPIAVGIGFKSNDVTTTIAASAYYDFIQVERESIQLHGNGGVSVSFIPNINNSCPSYGIITFQSSNNQNATFEFNVDDNGQYQTTTTSCSYEVCCSGQSSIGNIYFDVGDANNGVCEL